MKDFWILKKKKEKPKAILTSFEYPIRFFLEVEAENQEDADLKVTDIVNGYMVPFPEGTLRMRLE